jgi:glucose/arabinose dehydrogenase
VLVSLYEGGLFVLRPALADGGEPGTATPTPSPTPTTISSQAVVPALDPLPGPLLVGATNQLGGSGFTAGSVLVLFVSTGGGVQTFGPYAPSAWSPTTLSVPIPASVPLGNGFVSVKVVNTDQNFTESNLRFHHLLGHPSVLPSITAVDGVALEPPNSGVPLNSIATVLAQGATITITGSGFVNPRVALFSGGPNAVALTPLPGGTGTEIQVMVPMNTPTGPGALQVVNDPFVGNVLSNTVSVVFGAQLRIDSVVQNGSTITVTGAGFSSLTVISFFNLQGNAVVNLGGLVNGGQSLIPLAVQSSSQFTFEVPSGAVSGPSYVQALNPPFIPFTSSGNSPNGALNLVVPPVPRGGGSLRFFGTGSGDVDRVKIPLGDSAPGKPVDVGGDFTLEFWMKTAAGNASGACVAGGDGWINGNILFDRDVFGAGDDGDYGISLFGDGGRLAFGVDRMGSGTTVCGAADVADGAWHHVAVTRAGATLRIFVDGQLDAGSSAGPTGDVGYDNGRATGFPNSDPFLVIGAEKHDAGAEFPSFHGWIDEMRLSHTVRYTAAFTPPAGPFTPDAGTAALYHFDEGFGDLIVDSATVAGGPSHGERRVGGPNAGPHWSADTPFASGAPAIALQTLTTALSAPTAIAHAGDGRLFIAQQGGAIRIWNGAQLLGTPFLTVTPIASGDERGLLGLAFHPRYAQNGFFYVAFTNPSGDIVIARYQVSGDPNVANPNSGVTLLTIPHPGAANHNGGQLKFGPDGYLYFGMGDGGGSCDNVGLTCNAQRDTLLLGKLLRLDVDQSVDAPPYHGIPASNPFAGAGHPLDKVWAKGVRNPWRFTFDRLTGAMFIGDVGQNQREEVDFQPHDSPGGENYGWKIMEGTLCNTCSLTGCPAGLPPCNHASLTLPVLEYAHASGNCSITGGYAYRGARVPFLYGKYVYGDLCSGRIWWGAHANNQWAATLFTVTAPGLWTFGEDAIGELYVARGNGTLARIVSP